MVPAGMFASDTVALITGAASGIGATVASTLQAQGVGGLVLLDRNAEALLECETALARAGAHVLRCVQDVADETAWQATIEAVRQQFGRLDYAVANAGIAAGGAIATLGLAEWRRVMRVNLDGVFLTLKHSLPLIAAGGRGGAAVVVSSASAIKPEVGVGAYGASKAAVVQLARVAAKEHASDRIRVNVILPGGVDTPIWDAVPFFQDLAKQQGGRAGAIEAMGANMPLGRYATAPEIAQNIAHLLSPAAGPMTGAAVVLDSGYTL